MPFIPFILGQCRDGVFGAGRPALALGGWPAAARRGDGPLRAPTADGDEKMAMTGHRGESTWMIWMICFFDDGMI